MFNLLKHAKLGDEQSPNLFSECIYCGRTHNGVVKKCFCGTSFFKVARSFPLINYPLDPYRENGDEENGLKLTNPGNYDTSMGGNENYDIPQDGADGEETGIPNANSEDLSQGVGNDETLKGSNIPTSVSGIHNMNSNTPTLAPNPNVFQRTKSKLQYNYTKGQ